MPTKAELRRHLLAQRAVLTLAEIEHKSAVIAEYVCALPAFHISHTVMMYMALPQEVQTMQIIAQARQLQKRVVVPVVSGDHLRAVELSDDLAQLCVTGVRQSQWGVATNVSHRVLWTLGGAT